MEEVTVIQAGYAMGLWTGVALGFALGLTLGVGATGLLFGTLFWLTRGQ